MMEVLIWIEIENPWFNVNTEQKRITLEEFDEELAERWERGELTREQLEEAVEEVGRVEAMNAVLAE